MFNVTSGSELNVHVWNGSCFSLQQQLPFVETPVQVKRLRLETGKARWSAFGNCRGRVEFSAFLLYFRFCQGALLMEAVGTYLFQHLLSSGSKLPVLKHGPRSLTWVRATDSTIQCKTKVNAVTSATASN